jgi:uncharacterized protein YigE (DUF2233 family)
MHSSTAIMTTRTPEPRSPLERLSRNPLVIGLLLLAITASLGRLIRTELHHSLREAVDAVVQDSVRSRAARTAAGPRAEQVTVNGQVFDVVHVDARVDEVAIHWRTPSGARYGSLGALRDSLAARGRTLRFATNAGMFSPDFTPVGLYVEGGATKVPLNARDSAGNFYLKPNGVFFVAGDSVHVVETSEYLRWKPAGVRLATQSGPMLVHGGRIHPAFPAGSRNRYVRSGVGVRDGHIAIFAISRDPVDFHTIATLFRDSLHCDEALFLDGAISRMYVPALRRLDTDGDFAGVLSVSTPAAARK